MTTQLLRDVGYASRVQPVPGSVIHLAEAGRGQGAMTGSVD